MAHRGPGLDEAELRALLMAQPRVIGDTRLAAAAQRAVDKLLAALPGPMRERAASIRQRLYVDTTGWFGTAETLAALPIVQDAVARDRKLAIKYRRAAGEQVDRAVDPLGLVAKGTTWYLVAQTPAGFRTYRVSRIEEASILDVPCERPPHFDLAAHWTTSTEQFRDSRRRFDATLRLEPRAADKVRTWRMTSSPDATPTPAANGWVTLLVHFEDEEQARFVVLGFGPRVEVVEPVSLRSLVEADLSAVVQRMRPG